MTNKVSLASPCMCLCNEQRWGVCLLSQSIYVYPSPPFEQVAAWRVLFHLWAADGGISRGGRNITANFLLLFPHCVCFRTEITLVSSLSHE